MWRFAWNVPSSNLTRLHFQRYDQSQISWNKFQTCDVSTSLRRKPGPQPLFKSCFGINLSTLWAWWRATFRSILTSWTWCDMQLRPSLWRPRMRDIDEIHYQESWGCGYLDMSKSTSPTILCMLSNLSGSRPLQDFSTVKPGSKRSVHYQVDTSIGKTNSLKESHRQPSRLGSYFGKEEPKFLVWPLPRLSWYHWAVSI
jgi:hypothetical protein